MVEQLIFQLSSVLLFCYNKDYDKTNFKKERTCRSAFSTDVKIIQNKEVFSYSIDSVLLSRFPKIPSRGLIVDLCSGNGAVGLFAATRTKAKIIEVELQERLADMAQRSIQLNDLTNQVSMIRDDLKNLLDHVPRSKVDLILCNPPYFKAAETSKKNLSEHYLLARHEIATNLEEICKISQQVLKTNGRLAMVHRPDRFLEIIDTFKNTNWLPNAFSLFIQSWEKMLICCSSKQLRMARLMG